MLSIHTTNSPPVGKHNVSTAQITWIENDIIGVIKSQLIRTAFDRFDPHGVLALREKIRNSILKMQPLHLLLPGFPCKSPNIQDKVISDLPDLGEKLAIENLSSIRKQIAAVHPFGANLTIFSDGRIFQDVIKVGDEHIAKFTRAIAALLPPGINLVTLQNFLAGTNQNLLEEFLQILDRSEWEKEFEINKNSEPIKNHLLGTKRFLEEDNIIPAGMSRTAFGKLCKQNAKEMLFRADCLTTLLRKNFPTDIVRLSVHAHENVEKLGINMIPTQNAQHRTRTPWHNVPVIHQDGMVELMKKKQAIAKGCKLVRDQVRGDHFVAI